MVSQDKHSNPCHGEVKTICYASHWIYPGQQYKNKLPLRYKGYPDINPSLLSVQDHQVTQAAAENIEYNNMGAFQNSDCNTHGYYNVKWTDNAYTLQEKYKCHEFDPPVIIP